MDANLLSNPWVIVEIIRVLKIGKSIAHAASSESFNIARVDFPNNSRPLPMHVYYYSGLFYGKE
jgi:hypothetical protein